MMAHILPARATLFSWLLILLGMALTACSSNRCQTLCERYYELSQRCDLFGASSGQQPDACLKDASDPQVIQQRSEYAIRLCRQDFREVTCGELKQCCLGDCFTQLISEYDQTQGTQEQSYEQQREVCLKFRQLAETGEAPWCTIAQQSCLQSWCTDAQQRCPTEASEEPVCALESPTPL